MADFVPARRLASTNPFDDHLAAAGLSLRAGPVATLQVNVGRRCNQACRHCHVDAGPKRTEVMSREVAERVVELLDVSTAVATVDITGGAPELCPSFRWLVDAVRARGLEVIDRCNLTVLLEPDMAGTAEFLASRQVHVIASLPCYSQDNVDAQRGKGVFDRSIESLRLLNRLGYGAPGSALGLDLVYNPGGPTLPPPQAALEASYKRQLADRFGVAFHRLLTLTNLPIARFDRDLHATGAATAYRALLVSAFNPDTVSGLMCRSLISVSYDGALFDCDFNQMLELPLARRARTIWNVSSLDELADRQVATGGHCFGCTAGAGSSCGGALV